MMQTKKSLFSR